MYILDSDTLTAVFKFPEQHPRLLARIKSTRYERIWISVIVVEEAINGAYKLMHQDHDPAECYSLLSKVVMNYGKYQILPYDQNMMERYEQFQKEVKRAVGKRDRKIAASALEKEYTVVTGNLSHFRQTGAKCTNWIDDLPEEDMSYLPTGVL